MAAKSPAIFRDITNSDELVAQSQLVKREQFAVSLRKEKKKQILTKKRMLMVQKQQKTIQDLSKVVNLASLEDLHPAFCDNFTTIEDKHKLIMLTLQTLTTTFVQEERAPVCEHLDLLRVLSYTYQILGYRTKMAVPSKVFLELGLLRSVYALLFSNKAHEKVQGKALQVLSQLTCLHPHQCILEYTAQQRQGKPSRLIDALLNFVSEPGQDKSVHCRKIFRVLYNLVIDDKDLVVQLLKSADLNIFMEKGFTNNRFVEAKTHNFRQMLRDFYRVAFQIASDHELNFLIPEDQLKSLLKISTDDSSWQSEQIQTQIQFRDMVILEAILNEIAMINQLARLAYPGGYFFSFFENTFKDQLERLLLQNCNGQTQIQLLAAKILSELDCSSQDANFYGSCLRLISAQIETETQPCIDILSNLLEKSPTSLCNELPSDILKYLIFKIQNHSFQSQTDSILFFLHSFVVNISLLENRGDRLQEIVGLGLLEALISILARSCQTPTAYQCCICILDALMKTSVSIIDLFVELNGLELLENIAAGSNQVMAMNEEIKEIATELALKVRSIINLE